jgi:hypothetical protein
MALICELDLWCQPQGSRCDHQLISIVRLRKKAEGQDDKPSISMRHFNLVSNISGMYLFMYSICFTAFIIHGQKEQKFHPHPHFAGCASFLYKPFVEEAHLRDDVVDEKTARLQLDKNNYKSAELVFKAGPKFKVYASFIFFLSLMSRFVQDL